MYDFCINGGGMVGAALGLGLAQQGYQVAIIESNTPRAYSRDQAPDLRLSAISLTSVTLLKALGAWQHIPPERLRAYDTLSVWENPDMATSFTAASIDLPHLGYFVENRLIQLACHQALQEYNITWITDARLVSYEKNDTGVNLSLSNGNKLQARYLIGADGARSQVRQLADIGTTGWQYGQQALGITVKMQSRCDAETWQQFTPSGPRALLPMYDDYASLIWYDSSERIKQLVAMNSAALSEQIRTHFPARLGEFTVLDKAAFVLTRAHASDYVRDGVILIGDAAHTINPLAGQGVNLGFKDISALLTLTGGLTPDSDTFHQRLKAEYEAPRKRDNLLMMSAMDGFYLLFSNDVAPIKWVRNLMIKGTEMAGPLKHQVLKYAMGMDEWKF